MYHWEEVTFHQIWIYMYIEQLDFEYEFFFLIHFFFLNSFGYYYLLFRLFILYFSLWYRSGKKNITVYKSDAYL